MWKVSHILNLLKVKFVTELHLFGGKKYYLSYKIKCRNILKYGLRVLEPILFSTSTGVWSMSFDTHTLTQMINYKEKVILVQLYLRNFTLHFHTPSFVGGLGIYYGNISPCVKESSSRVHLSQIYKQEK